MATLLTLFFLMTTGDKDAEVVHQVKFVLIVWMICMTVRLMMIKMTWVGDNVMTDDMNQSDFVNFWGFSDNIQSSRGRVSFFEFQRYFSRLPESLLYQVLLLSVLLTICSFLIF